MSLFPNYSSVILEYTDTLHCLKVYVWTSLKHLLRQKNKTKKKKKKKKKNDIHKTKLTVNMFIILGYVNNYGKNHYL